MRTLTIAALIAALEETRKEMGDDATITIVDSENGRGYGYIVADGNGLGGDVMAEHYERCDGKVLGWEGYSNDTWELEGD